MPQLLPCQASNNNKPQIFSPLATVIAKNVAFICGSVLAVAILLTVWDEDVLNVEHLLTVMTVLGAAVAGARVFIPDENLVFCPEKTLTQVCTGKSLQICKDEIF